MAVGRVKWFNDEKGWGFIKQDAGPDVFVHYSQIQGDGRRRLYEDEVVEFEIKEGQPDTAAHMAILRGVEAMKSVMEQGSGIGQTGVKPGSVRAEIADQASV